MKWFTNLFVVAAVGLLAFGLYQFRGSESSARPGKPVARIPVQQRLASEDSASFPSGGLRPELLELASNLGFQEDTVQSGAVENELTTLDGESLRLSEFKNRWVILNFWASWCYPCREEMPSLQRLHEKLNRQRYLVLGVNVMEEKGKIESYLSDEKLSLPVVMDDDGTLLDAFGVEGLPETWIIAPNSKPLMRVQGSYEWDKGEMFRFVERLSDGKHRR